MALRLGTRGSPLALAQARSVATRLEGVELVPIRTAGDEPRATGARTPGTDGPSDRGAMEDKSRFVRAIERALLDGEVDLAVHSAKDLPSELPEGLRIASVPRRAEAADAFVGDADALATVPEGARIGTSSLRRRSQLLAARPDLEPVALRGNVDTRLRRLESGDFDGIVIAAAGLHRLDRADEISFLFDPAEMTPAAGQGTLALELRADDEQTSALVAELTDPASATELAAERSLIAALEASCNSPIGARARQSNECLTIDAYVGLPDGSEWVRDSVEGEASDSEGLGLELATRLSTAGARELLERAEQVAA